MAEQVDSLAGDEHSPLELGDDGVVVVLHDMVGFNQVVLHTFVASGSGHLARLGTIWGVSAYDLVLEGSDGETEGGGGFADGGEELSSVSGLQIEGGIQILLEDCNTVIGLLGLAISGGDEEIKDVNLVDFELDIFNSLVINLLIDDGVVSVDQVSGDFVGENSFEGVDSVGLTDLGDSLGDLSVMIARLQKSDGGPHAVVGGSNDVGLLAGDLGLSNDNGVGNDGHISIEVGSEIAG